MARKRREQELRPVMTRIPERLRRRLEREAERVGRLMNAEIIHRLEQSFIVPEQAEALACAVNNAAGAAFKGLYDEALREALARAVNNAAGAAFKWLNDEALRLLAQQVEAAP